MSWKAVSEQGGTFEQGWHSAGDGPDPSDHSRINVDSATALRVGEDVVWTLGPRLLRPALASDLSRDDAAGVGADERAQRERLGREEAKRRDF